MVDCTEIDSFVESLGGASCNANEIWSVGGGQLAIGIVLLAALGDSFVVVRKQHVAGYEFSGKLALPGGVVRGSARDGLMLSLRNSLRDRAKDEAGLDPENLTGLSMQPARRAPVTRYTVKCVERLSLVFAAKADITGTPALNADRASIQEVSLTKPPLDWMDYAPANRLTLAWALTNVISQREKRQHARAIEDALAFCNAAAADAAVPLLEPPWTDF